MGREQWAFSSFINQELLKDEKHNPKERVGLVGPIDTHPDHRAASLLVYDAWLRAGKKFALYYYEVELGSQTQNFWPTHYVDITSTEAHKRAACYAHASTVNAWYPLHEAMHRFRGMECGCKSAEAFIRHIPSRHEVAPGL